MILAPRVTTTLKSLSSGLRASSLSKFFFCFLFFFGPFLSLTIWKTATPAWSLSRTPPWHRPRLQLTPSSWLSTRGNSRRLRLFLFQMMVSFGFQFYKYILGMCWGFFCAGIWTYIFFIYVFCLFLVLQTTIFEESWMRAPSCCFWNFWLVAIFKCGGLSD